MNFSQIAIPHQDIINGKLTMDVYAANLSEVVNKKAPQDYVDSDLFFKKTYFTRGLKNILNLAEDRLNGKTGDSVIQLQTPFGGGKTHSLISLYHNAKKWNAKVVVFDGVAFSPKTSKPWEEVERQLTGKIDLTKGDSAPGSNALIKILSENSPVLILMDEMLEYITKAAAIKVGDSNLASQTFAFIQELTSAVSAIGNALLVITLPSSMLEHYDENAEKMYQQLQKITGRIEKVYTPVEDEEIEHVIKKRLFSSVNEKKAKNIVDTFIEHVKTEGLITQAEALEYRDRFLKSYPFKPEVVETLYKKWGTFSTFQRTRGVLRLLSLVVYSLLDSNIPFIRLGDFDLRNESIRRELIKYIGSEWEGIIAQDITGNNSGAKKIDSNLSIAYKPYKLGSVVSTTIFLNSFSGNGPTESSIKEIKLSTLYTEIHASEIDNVINQIREKLFYISDERLFFTNQANLNRIIVTRENTISKEMILQEERRAIKEHIFGNSAFKVYLYPQFSRDILDTPDLKLIIVDKEKPENDLISKYGEQPRVYRNTMIFLCKNETEHGSLLSYLKKLIALESIVKDTTIKLTDTQKHEIKSKLKSIKEREYEEIRKAYRTLFLPVRDGYRTIDMGLPTYGEKFIDKEAFDILKSKGEIIEKISPKVIKEKYLPDKEFIEVKKLFDAFLRTPGEIRLTKKNVFIESINEGIERKLFSLGKLQNNKIELVNKDNLTDLEDGWVITNKMYETKPEIESNSKIGEEKIEPYTMSNNSKIISDNVPKNNGGGEKKYRALSFRLDVPTQTISTISKVVNMLKGKFDNVTIKVEISATNGEILENEYENAIEAFYQEGIKIEKEKTE